MTRHRAARRSITRVITEFQADLTSDAVLGLIGVAPNQRTDPVARAAAVSALHSAAAAWVQLGMRGPSAKPAAQALPPTHRRRGHQATRPPEDIASADPGADRTLLQSKGPRDRVRRGLRESRKLTQSGLVKRSSSARYAIASAAAERHISGAGRREAQNAGRSGRPNSRQRLSGVS